MGNSNSNIKIDINAEVSGLKAGLSDATAKLDQLASSFDKHNAVAKQASGHMDVAEAAANKLTSAFSGLAQKVAGVFVGWKAAELIKESALLAARYETLGVSMRVVGNNAGYTAAEMEAAAVGMQKTGISMIESRQQALRLVQAHIDLTNSNKLARIAQDAAVIGNMNSSQAFATMIHGIQTGQTDVLRTIGLNISMEQSYAAYAATLGKSANALTQTEKMQAVLNAVMREGEGIAGTYEAAMGTAGKQLNSMTRYLDDLKLKAGEVFNEVLTVGVMAFTVGLKDANGQISELSQKNQLQQWGRDVTDMFAFLADAGMSATVPFRLIGKEIGALAALTAVAASGDGLFSAKGMPQTKAIMDSLHAEQQGILNGTSMFRTALAERRSAVEVDNKLKAESVNAFVEYEKQVTLTGAATTAREKNAILMAAARSMGVEYANKFPSSGSSAGPQPRSIDPNAAKVANIQMDAFKAQMDAMGVAAAQVKVYELAMHGADEKQIRAAQSSADIKIALDAQAKAAKEAGAAQDKAAKDHARAVEEANKIIFDIHPQQKANAEWEKLLSLQKEVGKEMLSDADIAQAYEKSFSKIDKAGNDAFKSLENAVRGWGNQFTDEMTKMVRTGKMNFSSLADSIINDLLRMQIQKNITEPLLTGGTNFLGSLFGSFGGGDYSSVAPGALASANGNVFSGAGISAYSGSVVDKPTLFPFARGVGLMGEAGEEAILPLTRINGKLGVQAQTGGNTAPNVVVQVINQSGQNVNARQQGGPQFDGRDWILGVVLEAADSNPGFRNAMGIGH